MSLIVTGITIRRRSRAPLSKRLMRIRFAYYDYLELVEEFNIKHPRMIKDYDEIKRVREYIKDRLLRSYTIFRGHDNEKDNIYQVIRRTAEIGESNSLLLIGPRGSGKSTMLNSIIADLMDCPDFINNTMMVYLNGYLHTDDRLALRSITIQLKLQNAADGKVFGSFAENLAFLLASLKSGSKKSKSVVFILEEFDSFCTHHNQTLLYNLFDVAQSAQAPICVIGVTCRLDVVELLEKRVKSRFSHRQIFLFPSTERFDEYYNLFKSLLSISNDDESKALTERISKLDQMNYNIPYFQRVHFNPRDYRFKRRFADLWNQHINELTNLEPVRRALINLFNHDVSQSSLKNFLYQLASQINYEQPCLTSQSLCRLIDSYQIDARVNTICGLSVLEVCLLIAINHHSVIYDRDPFNFEIIFNRFNKWAKTSSTMQGIEKPIALKAFEHLRNIELILPLSVAHTNRIQKEFEMHKTTLTNGQINTAILRYLSLPTEIQQWSQSSLI